MREIIYKYLLCVLLCLLSVTSGYAQYNNIYLFDCTKSMIYPTEEYYDKSKEDRTVYWEPAKEALQKLFLSCEDNDQLTIILFQDEVIDCIRGKRKTLSWNDIEQRLEASVTKTGNTCVCTAWDKAELYFQDSDYNFFYIFTDGNPEDGGKSSPMKCKHGHNINVLCDKIENFCRTNRRGFFVEVSDKAINEKIRNAVKGTNCIKIVDPDVYKKKFGLFTDNQVFVETSGMKKGGKSKSSPLGFSRKGNFNLEVRSNNPHFNVTVIDGGVKAGNASFAVSLKNPDKDIADIKRENNNHDLYDFDVVISSNDVLLLDSIIHVQVTLKPVRSLTVPKQDINYIDFGETDYYDEFFIPFLCKAKSPKMLTFNLSPDFNDEAKEKNASSEFIINGLPNGCKVYYNDSLRVDNDFKIQSTDNEAVLGILFPHGIESKDYEATITVKSVKHLDQIVGGTNGFYSNPRDYSIKIHASVDKSWNPLSLVLLILFIFLGIITIFLFVKNNVCSKYIYNLSIISKANPLIPIGEVNGCVKFILTSQQRRTTNSLLHRIYFGPIQYVYMPELKSDLRLRSNFNDAIIVEKNTEYSIDSIPLISHCELQRDKWLLISSNDYSTNIEVLIS